MLIGLDTDTDSLKIHLSTSDGNIDLEKTISTLEIYNSTINFSKEDAASSLSKDLGENFIDYLGYNPLYDSYNIFFTAENVNTIYINQLVNKFENENFVQEVSYDLPLIELINTNIKILNRWTKKEIIDQELVKVKNLSKTFDDNFFTENSKNSVMAVNDVSFEIKEGESFGIVGESGSGKSTIAKMIVKLFSPSNGDIYFDNVCITKIKNNKEMMKFRKQIQMIFQDPYSSLNGR